MFGTWTWLAVGLGLLTALICYDPNVPLDAEDYWTLLVIEKMGKYGRLKRFLFGGKVIQGTLAPQVAPVDPEINNFKTRLDGVDVRIYDPIARGNDGSMGPLLLYFHGGGFVKYDVDVYDLTTYHMSKGLPSYLVVSVDYRRAPKHPYPAPLRDAETVYRFLVEHAVSYKIDPSRIVVAGDSAGGNLAAALCLKLRNENRSSQKEDVVPLPKLQALIYPALQAVDFKTPSFQSYDPLLSTTATAAYYTTYLTGSEDGYELLHSNAHQNIPKIRQAANRFVKHALIPHHLIPSSYVAPQVNDDDSTAAPPPDLPPSLAAKIDVLSSDAYFSPLLAEDLTELPAAYVIACEYDVLRDDAILYGRRLAAAGVKTETRMEKGAWHAITFRLNMDLMKRGNQITADMLKYIEDNV